MTIERLNKSLELSIRNAANLLAWRHKLKARAWETLPGPALPRPAGYPDLRTNKERMAWYRLRVKVILRDL